MRMQVTLPPILASENDDAPADGDWKTWNQIRKARKAWDYRWAVAEVARQGWTEEQIAEENAALTTEVGRRIAAGQITRV